MSRPVFFRDPVHVQLRFDRTDFGAEPPVDNDVECRSWLHLNLIGTEHFQRLRFIKQNGLANYVFHGAGHSRFSHSLGVAHLAGEMFKSVVRNMDEVLDEEQLTLTTTAALLHDIGHGPFSHAIEEILEAIGVPFSHEVMTLRFIEDDASSINAVLRQVDATLPRMLCGFIDKRRRETDHWMYKIVSSQMDADRLDYLCRDAMFSGIKGHGFDLARIVDLLHHHDGASIAVERGARDAVEGYLVTLDQLYRIIYYHHTVRAANFLLSSTIRRAVELHGNGDNDIFMKLNDNDHPMCRLFTLGEGIPIEDYARIGEQHIWVLLDQWRYHHDPILKDLAGRMLSRNLLKTIEIDPTDSWAKTTELFDKAKELVKEAFVYLDDDTVDYYVGMDEPSRTSYRRYEWKPESPAESIWLTGKGKPAFPIENDDNRLLQGLSKQMHFPRIVLPEEVRRQLV